MNEYFKLNKDYKLKNIIFSIIEELVTNDLKYGKGISEWSFIYNKKKKEIILSLINDIDKDNSGIYQKLHHGIDCIENYVKKGNGKVYINENDRKYQIRIVFNVN